MNEEQKFMQRALELAARGAGATSPNPAVGAVITQSGGVVGEGWHEYAGGPHAEINALNAAGHAAFGGTMYVTLEPCNVYGKTPPCTDAIVAAGIARVVAAAKDPNPAVSGRGFQALREAGVEVEEGVEAEAAVVLNEGYNKHVVTGMPFVTIKIAMSADGKIATKTGSSRWITGEAAREKVHAMRAKSDAVMTGIGTIEVDNPRLDVRLPDYEGRQPARVIIDARGKISTEALVIKSARDVQTIVATTDMMSLETSGKLAEAGAEVIITPRSGDRIDLKKLLGELGHRGFCSVFLEAGSALATAFIGEGLVDKFVFFVAPKLIGGTAALGFYTGIGVEDVNDAAKIRFDSCEMIDGDIMITGYPAK